MGQGPQGMTMFWEHFGAPYLFAELNKLVSDFQRRAEKDNEQLVVTMQTPDGRTMIVSALAPRGQVGYVADGFVGELPCSVFGHVSTLKVFFAFEKGRKGSGAVGFTVKSGATPLPLESLHEETIEESSGD